MASTKPLPKYGVQIKTQYNCKICQSENRASIEDTLYLRQAGELLPNGIRPTLKWFIENSASVFGVALNEDNIKSHLKRHFSFTGKAEAAVVRKEADIEAIRDGFDDNVAVAPDEFLQSVVSAAARKVQVSPESVTLDHGLKAVAELTKRKTSDRDALLMGALVDALSAPKQAAPADEVIEAEVVAEIPPPGEPDAEPS